LLLLLFFILLEVLFQPLPMSGLGLGLSSLLGLLLRGKVLLLLLGDLEILIRRQGTGAEGRRGRRLRNLAHVLVADCLAERREVREANCGRRREGKADCLLGSLV
jgi:hypothetical protein